MRRDRNDRVVKIVLLTGVVAVAAAAVAVASATLTSSGGSSSSAAPAWQKPGKPVPRTASGPTIMAADYSPLRVRGLRFKSGERVRVSVNGEGQAIKSVTANRNGAFAIAFAGIDMCSLTVVATGDKGSRASFQFSSFVCD